MPVLRDRQREQLIELFSVFQVHDEFPQFSALLFPNHVTAWWRGT
jgi:hypothetical protein